MLSTTTLQAPKGFIKLTYGSQPILVAVQAISVIQVIYDTNGKAYTSLTLVTGPDSKTTYNVAESIEAIAGLITDAQRQP